MKAAIFAWAALFTIILFGGVSRGYAPPPPDGLTGAVITFHTKDDNKDHDTSLSVTVTAGDHQVGKVQNSNNNNEFRDNSDNDVNLDGIDKSIEPKDCNNIHVAIHIDPNGHDTWKFNYTVVLKFADGSVYTYDHTGDVIVLSQDARDGGYDDTHK